MAKSLKSIYFESELIIEAEKQGMEKRLNDLCNEALRMALNNDSAAGLKLREEADLRKDNNTMRRIEINKDTRQGSIRWGKAVTLYAQKYGMDIADVLRKFD